MRLGIAEIGWDEMRVALIDRKTHCHSDDLMNAFYRRSDVLAVVPLVLDRSCFFEPTLSNVTMEARKPVFNDQLGEGDPFVGQAIIPSIPA